MTNHINTPGEAGTGDYALFKGTNRAIAEAVAAAIHEMREYWPLTVRQAYYQGVSRLIIPNHQNEYRRVSRILTILRRNDLLPWYAIEDRTRTTTGKRGRPNVGEFIASELDSFLNPQHYGRCYIQDQEVYVEVATEKDALASIIGDAVYWYCTRLNVVRGQVSATMVNDIAGRFDRAAQRGKRLVLLYLGDLDPSGIAIPKALKRNLYDWHSLDVDVIRVALNPEQVSDYQLPVSLDAAKAQDPNYRAWREEYGNQAPCELDALHPRDLTTIVKSALESVYDMASVDSHKTIEAQERETLKAMRRRVQDFVAAEWPELFRAQ